MKGNDKLLETLNPLLADEPTAINQYMAHAETCENWGCGKLHAHFQKRSIDEIEERQDQIKQMGEQPCLSVQVEE